MFQVKLDEINSSSGIFGSKTWEVISFLNILSSINNLNQNFSGGGGELACYNGTDQR